MMGLDVGPKTIQLLEEKIGDCKTVVWNGVRTHILLCIEGAARKRICMHQLASW